ncbi:MAG TPA: pilus assembly protein TadG-related protein [Gemmatimonadaceae bacterium]
MKNSEKRGNRGRRGTRAPTLAKGQLENRRGVTLLVVAMLSVTLFTCLAVVIDMSRMYNQKNDLQTAADAAALAGVIQQIDDTAHTVDSAVSFGQKNKVLYSPITVNPADVVCGQWDAVTQTYLGNAGHCGSTENTVTVTVRDSARYIMAGLLGTSKQVTAKARAYAAYVGAQTCVKPWAIPYVTLTKLLQPTNPDTLRDLDAVDIQRLKSMTKAQRTFMLKIGAPPDAGNFGSLDIPDPNPAAPNAGAALYKWNIEQCNSRQIAAGDSLYTETGGKTGPTIAGVEDYCDFKGTFDNSTGNCLDENGNLGIVTKAALWSQRTDKGGGKYTVTVRQIVSFVLENMSGIPDAAVTGYFLPIKTGGAITTTATTTQRPILIPDGSN